MRNRTENKTPKLKKNSYVVHSMILNNITLKRKYHYHERPGIYITID